MMVRKIYLGLRRYFPQAMLEYKSNWCGQGPRICLKVGKGKIYIGSKRLKSLNHARIYIKGLLKKYA